MFSRSSRLSRNSFSTVLKRGKRLSSVHFSLTVSSEQRGYAVVVSKKVAKLSVTRHRLKRKVVAALKPLPLPPGLIVFPKASAAGIQVSAMTTELRLLLSKL